jgi:MFS family permease
MPVISRASAMRFVILLGTVSLFADVTYEGARSVLGPYFASLGASATIVGFVAGAGELAGYGLRLFAGYMADRTRAYWALTIIGYVVNLLAVPALALAGRWEVAAALVILERTGKSIRTPARDVMLSHATHEVGRGWGFGLHEMMDQIGAVAGPLVVTFVLARTHHFGTAFLTLAIPAGLAILSLVIARVEYPAPRELEPPHSDIAARGWSPQFWAYMAGAALLAAGFVDFPLVSYHLEKHNIVATGWIPALYSAAMAVEAGAALIFGRWFDRVGFRALPAGIAIALAAPPLLFFGTAWAALGGMICWGLGMGAQGATLRAGIATLTNPDRRGAAYGLFNTAFGIAWFAGSAIMGRLYDLSIAALVAFGVTAQALSAIVFVVVARRSASPRPA